MKIKLISNPTDAPCCVKIEAKDGRDVLIQTDYDFPSVASSFGWNMADVQPDKQTAFFNRFSLELPMDCVTDCGHAGRCDDDVEFWSSKLPRPESITPERLAAELKEYGAWNDDELADDTENWKLLIWLAAGQIKDEKPCDHEFTDGAIDCPERGVKAGEFIQSAREWIEANDGAETDDPGYFPDCATRAGKWHLTLPRSDA